MSLVKFDLIVAAILDGKYSLACILMLRFYDYDRRDYIAYGTYNRLMKENLKLEKRKSALAKHYHSSQKLLGNRLGLSKELETTAHSDEPVA